jgi:IrrE N-terminal-like domain
MNRQQIEREAWKLQFEIWSERKLIWPNTQPPILAMFEPRIVADFLGFEYDIRERLGAIDSRHSEAAGIIDLSRKIIAVSSQFSEEERRFTAAHEIGHAVLHSWIGERVVHRDRPIFEIGGEGRAQVEREADYFAACLLAPKKLVVQEFERRFGTRKPLPMTETTVFHLRASQQVFAAPRGSLMFGRAVATAESFDSPPFRSLCKHFGLSSSAMAIRLHECELIVD